MIDKDYILKRFNKIEDKLFLAKVIDKALRAHKVRISVYSDFMDPYQRSLVEKALSFDDEVDFIFDGGYEGAERVIAIFRPNFMSFDEEERESPLKLVALSFNSRQSLTHRDYLGALIGLGIKREKIGDILVRDDGCSVITMKEIAEYIKYNLVKIGNVKVNAELKEMDDIEVSEPEAKTINTTVASLRLDCVAAAGFGLSRGKISDFIDAEKVFLNWDPTTNPAKLIKEGDTITVRGKGRMFVEEIGRVTKKGRIGVLLKKLI